MKTAKRQLFNLMMCFLVRNSLRLDGQDQCKEYKHEEKLVIQRHKTSFRQTDGQTDRQTDRRTDGQTDKCLTLVLLEQKNQTHEQEMFLVTFSRRFGLRLSYFALFILCRFYPYRQTDRQICTRTDRKTERYIDRQYRQTDRQTDRGVPSLPWN